MNTTFAVMALCSCILTAAPVAPALPTSDQIALKMLDGEALYTLAGIKPASDGFWQTRFPADQATSPELDRVRQHLAAWP
ncbi:MAG: hypothetical protein ACRCZF_28280, partial [Gemmataceae bacterium]